MWKRSCCGNRSLILQFIPNLWVMPLLPMIEATSNGSTGLSRTADKSLRIILGFIMNLRSNFALVLLCGSCESQRHFLFPFTPTYKNGQWDLVFTDLRLPGEQRWRPKTKLSAETIKMLIDQSHEVNKANPLSLQ